MTATPDADPTTQRAAAFSAWLRTRMEAGAYATQGSRPGGQVRLAKDAGLTASIISRALGGQSVPAPEAVLQLAKTLGSSPVEAFRAAGYDAMADLIEASPAAPSDGQLDPVAARIEHAAGLTPEQRAWLTGFSERRRRQDAAALIAEIDELIRFLLAR